MWITQIPNDNLHWFYLRIWFGRCTNVRAGANQKETAEKRYEHANQIAYQIV